MISVKEQVDSLLKLSFLEEINDQIGNDVWSKTFLKLTRPLAVTTMLASAVNEQLKKTEIIEDIG